MVSLVLALALALAGCTGHETIEADPPTTPTAGAVVAAPSEDVLLDASSAQDLAVQSSQAFFASAGIVVLSAADEASQLRAAWLAMRLGLPALVTGVAGMASEAVITELERLGTQTVLVVGDAEVPVLTNDGPYLRAVPAPDSLAALQVVINQELEGTIDVAPGGEVRAIADSQAPFSWMLGYASAESAAPVGDLADLSGLPPYLPTERTSNVAAITTDDASGLVALGTARAAGADVVVTEAGEIATDASATAQIAALQPEWVVGVGAVGQLSALSYRVRVAASGAVLPGGGQAVLPGKRYLAMRGIPGDPESGPLGEQDAAATFARISQAAASWTGRDNLVPTATVLATTLTSDPGSRGTYTEHLGPEQITPVIEAATAADGQVLLSFQPGRETFDSQLRSYADLLRYPNVGVVLEPRASLSAAETPQTATGATGDAQVADAIAWVADFVNENQLPPKLVVVTEPGSLGPVITYRPEVAVVIQIDGEAVTPPEAAEGEAVTAALLWANKTVTTLPYWGWRQGTQQVDLAEIAALSPSPVLVTY